jgi:hypothetical protein
MRFGSEHNDIFVLIGDMTDWHWLPHRSAFTAKSTGSPTWNWMGKPAIEWSGRRDSNPRPSGPKPDALPDCATPRLLLVYRINDRLGSQRAEDTVASSAEERVEETIEDPGEQKHRQNDEGCQHKTDATEKEPALNRVFSWFVNAAY